MALPGTSFGQNGDAGADVEVPAEAAAPKVRVEAIPVDQIGVRAERTQRMVAELERSLEADDVISQIASSLPERTAAFEQQLARSVAIRAGVPNVVMVDQLRYEWRVIRVDLDAAQAAIDDRATAISRLRDELAGDFEVWTATRAAAVLAAEGSEVVQLIDGTLADLERAREEARKVQGDLASLQGKVAALNESAAAEVEALADLRRGLMGKVLERDQPAIWSADFYGRLTPDGMGDLLREHADREVAALQRFGVQHRERLIVQLVLTVVLIPLMYSARARVRRIEDDDDAVSHMQAVFEGPISLALMISFFVGFWGYEEFPPLAGLVIGAAFLLPAVLMLRRLLEPSFFPLLYLLLVLFFVDRLIDAVAPLPALPRVIFVGEMIAVFLYSRSWHRASLSVDVPVHLRSATNFKWVSIGTRVAMWAAPVVIAAELAGYTAIARLVGGSVLTAGYAAIVLYGSARAIDGLVAWALIVRPFRLSGMAQRQRVVIEQHVKVYTRWVVTGLFFFLVLTKAELADPAWAALQAFWNFEIPLISVGLSFGSIIEFLIVVRLTFAASTFLQFVLDEEVYTRVRMPKGQPYAISTLTHYAVLLIGFVLAVFALGVDVNRFTVLAGAFGVGIGFGLQTIVNNFVSGIILLTEQPVQVGDTVELEGVFGEVQRIGIRSSTVRTWQGAEVIVPNSQLVAEQVTNWTLSDDKRRLEIPVGVAYGTDPERVQAILLRVAGEHLAVIERSGSPGLLHELRRQRARVRAALLDRSARRLHGRSQQSDRGHRAGPARGRASRFPSPSAICTCARCCPKRGRVRRRSRQSMGSGQGVPAKKRPEPGWRGGPGRSQSRPSPACPACPARSHRSAADRRGSRTTEHSIRGSGAWPAVRSALRRGP